MPKRPRSFGKLLLLLSLALATSILLALSFGSAKLSLHQLLQGLLHTGEDPIPKQILWVVRLPHTAGCLLCGAALAVSGVLLQTATGNPLAGPNIIGVNAGAGFSMILGLCLFPMAYRLQPLMAFLGAFACTLLIVTVADRAGGSKVTIVLSGVAVSALLSAGISLLKLTFPDAATAYNHFSVGGVSGVTFRELTVPAMIIAVVSILAQLLSRRLDLLCLGDTMITALGIHARRLRMIALLLASAAAAAAVSFAGLMGFVGLMVPHIARRLLPGGTTGHLLPISALLGATLVILSDLLGRVLLAPSEIPAGIITAILGAPFFFVLLLKRGDRL